MFWQLKQRNTKGKAAETLAMKHLKSQGLTLIRENYASRMGELDLIMLDQNTLVFIEVRYRSLSRFGSAQESITHSKRRKIQNTSAHFLQTFPQYQHHLCRFDVITINATKSNNDERPKITIEWLKGAFQETF